MNKETTRLGVYGWLSSGKRGIEGYLFLLHRITGIALLAFLCLHVFVSSFRLFGEQAWAWAMAMTHSALIELLEYAVFVAFVFHAFNGVRLIAIELGFVVGQPAEPVFPYKGSIAKQRPLTITIMVLAGAFIVMGGLELLRLT